MVIPKGTTVKEKRTKYLKFFENLLYDAVYLAYSAHDIDTEKDDAGYEFTLIRSSILNTMLLLECAANCCIHSLRLPQSYYNDIDKLPSISKYEFFLKTIKPNCKFDRGSKEVQTIAELKSLRDKYVHPKVNKKDMVKIDKSTWDVDFGNSELLGIPFSMDVLKKESAVKSLKAVNDFFNKFFLEWCEFDKDTVCSLLLGDEETEPDVSVSFYVDGIWGLNRAVNEWGIDFKFIGKDQCK